jgi:hypothetical protein
MILQGAKDTESHLVKRKEREGRKDFSAGRQTAQPGRLRHPLLHPDHSVT